MACLPSVICHHHLSSLAGFRVSCTFRVCGVLQCCVLYGGANEAFDEIRVPQRLLHSPPLQPPETTTMGASFKTGDDEDELVDEGARDALRSGMSVMSVMSNGRESALPSAEAQNKPAPANEKPVAGGLRSRLRGPDEGNRT